MPCASFTACVSAIIALQSARRPVSVVMRSRVVQVRALIGLKQILPQSWSQTFQRISSRITGSKPAPDKTSLRTCTRRDRLPLGSPNVNRLNSLCSTTPGAITSEAGWITQPTACVKIPPRNAIYCRDNRGIVPQQREKFRSARIGLMCLQRADHDVLRTKCSWVIARLNPGDLRVALGQQFQTVLLDRLKMCAAGNGTNVMSSQR